MSYTKLEIRYIGDGMNSAVLNSREGEKRRVINLPKKVQEYGDRYGYESLAVSFWTDHIIIKHGITTLMDKDFNGSAHNEYIRELLSYEWIGEDGSRLKSKKVEKTEPVVELKPEEDIKVVEEKIEEAKDEVIEENDIDEEFDDDDDFCDNVTYQGLEYSCYDGEAEATMFEDEKLETADTITIPQTITDEESGKTFIVTGYTISDGTYTHITFPSTLKYIQGETFSDMDEDVLNQLQHNLAENKNFVVKERYIYQHTRFEDDEQAYQLCNVQLNRPKGSFAIPEGVQAIARGLFTNCDQLTEIIIPSSVRHIDDAPFEGCSALKRIVIYAPEHQVKCYDDCGEECKLARFIPKGVELVYMSNPVESSPAAHISKNASTDAKKSTEPQEPIKKHYVDIQKVENYLQLNANALPADKIDILKESLSQLTEEEFKHIRFIDLKKTSVTVILAVLFGLWGVDRFYLGDIALGIAKWITAGGYFIWWILDVLSASKRTKEYNCKLLMEQVNHK